MKRLLLLAAALTLLLPACREDRKPMTDAEREAVLKKTDDRLLRMIETGEPERAAVIAVFDKDVFMEYGQALEENGITILNEFSNAALLLATGAQVRGIASAPGVRRIGYFSSHGRLGRLDPVLEMELLRRAGEGAGSRPVTALVRFGRAPGEKDRKTLSDAGFSVESVEGAAWAVTGPARDVSRILDMDGVVYVESASK